MLLYKIFQDICKSLWCFRGRKRCETKFLPAAEGTSCGHGRVGRQYFTGFVNLRVSKKKYLKTGTVIIGRHA